jgi:hypothetical protein
MSTNPSPQPSPRLGGERELFPFGACVNLPLNKKGRLPAGPPQSGNVFSRPA